MGKWVTVNGRRWKVPVRWRSNVWLRAAFADGVAAALARNEKGKK